jgi:hypothetical protein
MRLTPTLSLEDGRVHDETLWFYRRALRLDLYEFVLENFHRLEATRQLTKRKLADRLGKNPSQITRWLAEPGNWTLNTVSDLLVGMAIDPRDAIAQVEYFEDDTAHAAIQAEGSQKQVSVAKGQSGSGGFDQGGSESFETVVRSRHPESTNPESVKLTGPDRSLLAQLNRSGSRPIVEPHLAIPEAGAGA